jgi:hypothetical protein
MVDGRLVVSRSTQPMLDSAGVLLAEGADPTGKLVRRQEGQDYDALRSTIGAAAKLRVTEDRGRPIFRDWAPYDGRQIR